MSYCSARVLLKISLDFHDDDDADGDDGDNETMTAAATVNN